MVNKPESETKSDYSDKPEWLVSDIFLEFLEKDFPNIEKIKAFQVTSAVPTGENFLTILLRVKLEVELDDGTSKTTSYMVKVQPKTEQTKQMVSDWQVFTKEQITYKKYIPQFEDFYEKVGSKVKFAPKHLELKRVHIEDDVLILEDLRLRGFKNFNRHLGLDMVHTEAVLRKLAQFHAASAKYVEVVEEFPQIYDQCFATDKNYLTDLNKGLNQSFRDHLKEYGEDLLYLEKKLVSIYFLTK